jgi:nucleoid DNA-binding protein
MAKKAAPKAAAKSSSNKAMTKAEIYSELAEKSGLTKKQVAGLFDAMSELITKELGKKGPGLFVVPSLLKIRRVHRPATKAKQGINPFTKQPMTIPAKPARNVIKASPLKSLKESV